MTPLLRLLALTLVCCLVAAESGRSPDFDMAETEARLFDHQSDRIDGSRLAVQAASIDVAPTVRRWSRSRAMGEALAAGVDDLSQLVSFSATAYGEEPPRSANPGTAQDGNGPSGCSVGAQGPGATRRCSTNTTPAGSGGGPTGYGGCSTNETGGGTGTPVCSAYGVSSAEGSDNTPCSVGSAASDGIPEAAQGSCSAGGEVTPGTSQCSTAGGQSTDDTNGSVACSAAGEASYPEQTPRQSCSAFGSGDGQSATCSTYSGQHQNCSAGANRDGNESECSAYGSNGTATSGFCSASSGSTGEVGNKCSAIAYNPPGVEDTDSDCSAFGGTNGSCSVMGVEGDNGFEAPSNAGCSAIGRPGEQPPSEYSCSTQPGSDGTAGTGSCSVINPETGETVSGPENDRCGTFTPHPEDGNGL